MSNQQIDYCLDLRELVNLDDFPQVHGVAVVDMLLDAGKAANGFTRVYIGSSFCPQSFHFSIALMKEAIAVCQRRGILVSLSIPVVSQRFLSDFLVKLDELITYFGDTVDELVANDLGMLGYLCDVVEEAEKHFELTGERTAFFGKGVVIGRLLNKDTRDPRDPEYPWIPCVPNMLKSGWERSSYLDSLTMTWSYWNEKTQSYRCPIVGIEFDPTHETLLLGDLASGLTASLNGPLCYMSTGQICEYASVGLPDEQAFRPNSVCAHQCTHTCICYQGVSGVEFIKLGRTVYFNPPWTARVEGVERYRQLVSILKEVRG